MVRGEWRKMCEVRWLNFWAERGDVWRVMGGRGWVVVRGGGEGDGGVWREVV